MQAESSSDARRRRSISSEEEGGFGLDDLIPTPESPLPAPFSFSTYDIPDDVHLGEKTQLILRLVGTHPLWGHHLWNTARCLSTYLLRNPTCIQGRKVLELGAGAGLPSIVCALAGSQKVIVTDYPDNDLLNNLRYNVDINVDDLARIDVDGHVWGHDVRPLLAHVDGQYDLLILSDLVFNHSQHDALIKTVEAALSYEGNASILVFFTHHRPHLAQADMEFFKRLSTGKWAYEKVVEEWTGPMFEEDPGDERIRGTVHGWRAWRVADQEDAGERPPRI